MTNDPSSLHPGTLLFAISMFGFLMAGISASAARVMPEHRHALMTWSKAMVGAGAGFLLYFFRGQAPFFLTYLVANVLVIGCAAFGHMAFAHLLGVRPSQVAVTSVSAFCLAGVLATYAFGAAPGVAVFTVSSGVSALFGMTAAMLAKRAREQRTAPLVVGATVTMGMSAGFVARAMIGAFGDAATVSPPAANSVAQVVALLLGPIFLVIASLSFFAIVHEQLRLALVVAASRDGLTGVLTRSAFFERAADLDRAPTTARYAIVMVDIDHFKSINDAHGHAAGDVTLAHAGRLLAAAVRISDHVGRYGGEEFSILLRDCSEEQAASLARRIVSDAGQQTVRLADGHSLKYTVSAGYAVVDKNGLPRELFREVMERADQALYRAKRDGRNRALAAHPRANPAMARA